MSWNFPDNWYWLVTDSSPGTQVWQSSSGGFVVLANADYVAFLAAGNLASIIDTATNLYIVINAVNDTVPHSGYLTISIASADYVLTSPLTAPLPTVVAVSSNGGGHRLILPQVNLFGSTPLGVSTVIQNNDLSVTLPVCFSGTITPLVSIPPLGAAIVIPIANDTPAGSWDSFLLNNFPVSQGGTGNVTLTAHSVLLGEGTTAVGFATIGTAGRLLIDQGAAADPAFKTMSGDATITNLGVITVAKVNGVSFPSSYTSGGIPYASGTGTIASSALMTLNGVIYGGGAGASPLVTAQGGANTVLIANAGAPSFSAAPVIGTSVTTPISYGGSAVGSTKTINGTSNGSPVAAYLLLQTNGQNVGIGANNATPGSILSINSNAAAPPAAVFAQAVQLTAADGQQTGFNADTFGVNAVFTLRRADGTNANPTAVQSGEPIGTVAWRAYVGSNGYTAAIAQIACAAAENFTNSTNGTYVRILTTSTSGGTIAEAVRIQPSGGFSIGTTTDPGIGSLQVNAQFFGPNITQTSAAVTGTLCWTTGTGKFTVDTTTTCLLSAERYKHDFRPLDETMDSLALVLRTTPGSFYYNDDVGILGEQIGFRAEDMAALDDRLVSHVPDGRVQSVRYQQYTAVLTGAIQALNAKIEQIERRAA
jgi:hypothetical protein